jgi:pyruvate kinase
VPRHPSEKTSAPLAELSRELQALQAGMVGFERKHADALLAVTPQNQASARNLLHYLAMRQHDLRALQARLAALGLSSIGRAESHALYAVEAVSAIVRRLNGEMESSPETRAPCDLESGSQLLDAHTDALFGPVPPGRAVRVMLTMPGEAAGDYTFVRNLLDAGMDCMRINCAHDDPEAWSRMIQHLRHASQATGRPCSVLMDVAGPKLRTGDVMPGPAVKKVRPTRDAFGVVTAPAVLWLTATREPAPPPSSAASGVLQVDGDWLAAVEVRDKVSFRDTRGRRRVLTIVDRDRGGVWAELNRTAYFTNGTRLEHRADGANESSSTEISGIPAAEGAIRVVPGDLLILTSDASPGRGPTYDSTGRLLSPARVSCTLPEVFADVQAGERVCLDDGKITGIAESVSGSEIRVRVQRTPPRGARLAADKGINLPDSRLHLPSLTAKDIQDLQFVAAHADLVGLSFVNHESDVLALIDALSQLGAHRPGIVLKIETQRALARLPAILLAAMRHENVGVMIARGDLAIEVGYQRLAEAQEEILWICEAAHLPAIWATQVLDNLAKEGTPSRAEITDAAMGHRAECVMLNKGPHITEAIGVLDDILKRMDSHQSKKSAMLRALHLATEFTGLDPAVSAVQLPSTGPAARKSRRPVQPVRYT